MKKQTPTPPALVLSFTLFNFNKHNDTFECPYCDWSVAFGDGDRSGDGDREDQQMQHLRCYHPEAITSNTPDSVDPMVADARRMTLAIALDMAKGVLPVVDNFTDLHEYVDANDYFDECLNAPDTYDMPGIYLPWFADMGEVVDVWMQRGVVNNLLAVARGAHGMPTLCPQCEAPNSLHNRSVICGYCSDEVHAGKEVTRED